MELVYLWVEDYKNIHKQGFNFSPKFECKFYDEYDEDGKLKDNCKLEIIEKKEDEYIKDFFGENINITAIVGKNGSGKSSLLSILKYTNSKMFLLFRLNNKNYLFSNKLNVNCLNNSFIQIKDLENLRFLPYISESANITRFKVMNKIIGKLRTYKTENNFLINFKHIFYPNDIVIYNKKDLKKDLIDKISSNSFFDKTNIEICDDSIRDIIDSKRDCESFISLIKEDSDIEVEYDVYIDSLIENAINEKGLGYLQRKFSDSNTFPSEDEVGQILYESGELKEEEYDDWIEKNISSNNIYKIIYEKMLNGIKEELDRDSLALGYLFNKIIEKNLIFKYFDQRITYFFNNCNNEINNSIKDIFLNIDEIDKFLKNNLGNVYISKKNKYQKIEKYYKKINKQTITKNEKEEILKNYQDFFIIDFIEIKENKTKKYFKDLSHGEKTLYSQFVIIFHEIYESNHQGFVLLLDEPDLSLHPAWQRNYVDELLKLISILNKKTILNIHIILTSHSPFLLSDIPKQNIIFLDRYNEDDEEVKNQTQKKGNCKVVDGLSHTFGANIHTLLSDSFFMEDGLMGEFAKNKINKIIRFLNEKNKFIDFPIEQIEKVINTIGEPFLKEKLSKMYFDKFDTKKQDRIKELKAELKRLENG